MAPPDRDPDLPADEYPPEFFDGPPAGEPPFVYPEKVPVARRIRRYLPEEPPQPGILLSIVWCFGLLASLWVPLIIVGMLAFGIQVLASGDAEEFVRKEWNQMRDMLESNKAGKPAGPEPAMPESFSYSVAAGMAAGHVGTLVFTLVALRYGTGRNWRRIVALRRPRLQHMLLAVLLLPGMMLTHSSVHLLLALMFDIDPNEGEAGLESMVSPWPMWIAVLLLGVGPGVIEELFCRGFLGRGLLARYGYPLGIVLTSIFFGLLHLAPLYAIGTAVMGVMLHLTYVYTRSLWVPIFLHFANNSIPALALTGGPTPPGADQAATEVSWVSYLTAVVLTVVGLATLWTARARLVAVDESGRPDPQRESWQPRYPGLELPPPGSGTVLRSNWANPVLVLLTCLCFGGLIYSFSMN